MKSRLLSTRRGLGLFGEGTVGRIRPIVFSSSSRAQEGDAAAPPFGAEDCEVQTYSGVRHRWIPTVPWAGVLGGARGEAALEGEDVAAAQHEVHANEEAPSERDAHLVLVHPTQERCGPALDEGILGHQTHGPLTQDPAELAVPTLGDL